MLQDEEMFEMRVNSPNFSDNSSLGSGCGLDEMEDFELFPDLKELTTRQVSSDSNSSKENCTDSNKRNIVAVRLDPGKEKELINYLLGKSEDGSQSQRNGDILQTIQDTVAQSSVPKNLVQKGGGSGFVNVVKSEYLPKLYTSGRELEGKCMSKNAVAARENRQRKKQYIGDLEQSVKSLSAENKNLKSQVSSMQQTVGDLRTEVKYLRSVLANQSILSALLKNIPSVPGINLTTSATDGVCKSRKGGKRPREDDSDEENIDSNIQLDESNDDVDAVGEITVDCTSDIESDSRSVQSGGVCTRGQMAKVPKLDHSYATNNPTATRYQKRIQLKAQEQSRNEDDKDHRQAGVCLHVSGNKVSLEFCSQCSKRASTEERQQS